jgi:hypothetical protein
LLLGCAPTAVVLDITLDGHDAAPSSLTASVYDPHRALVLHRAVGTHLPGRLTLDNLPSLAVPLRIALDGNGGLEAGAAVTITPGTTVHGSAQLSNSTRDTDGDGVPDIIDNCPTVPNPDQANQSGGTLGNACELLADSRTTRRWCRCTRTTPASITSSWPSTAAGTWS